MSEGMESMGLDLKEQEKLNVTFPGEAGYRGAWDENVASAGQPEATKDMVRDAAIEGADSEALTDAITNMQAKLEGDPANKAEILAALTKARATLDALIQKNQH